MQAGPPLPAAAPHVPDTMADAPAAAPAASAWSGRFAEPMSDRMQRFNASVDFDRRLAAVDIDGSLAHARMLAAVGVLSAGDLAAIERGMAAIRAEIDAGTFAWSRANEDVHFNIEKRLTALVGDAGKRLHTARSRNDQVATDIRLWLRGAIDGLQRQLAALRRAFIDLAERNAATIMPGFTHLQVAQPVTFGHHLLAYEAMLARDSERLPTAAAASTGCRWAPPRSRDELPDRPRPRRAGAGIRQRHRQFAGRRLRPRLRHRVRVGGGADHGPPVALRRGAHPLVEPALRLRRASPTGSAPAARSCRRRRTPTSPSWSAARARRVAGHLAALVVLMKGQPLTYNKDNQEDKEPLFDTVDTLSDCLAIMADLVGHRARRGAGEDARRRARGLRHATDLADYLVKKGLPFRDAHEAVARAVRHAEAQGCDLADLPLDELRRSRRRSAPTSSPC